MKILITTLFLLQSCLTNKPITITEFTTYNKPVYSTISLGKEMIYYNNFFLVSNYRNHKQVEMELDSFVINFTSNQHYAEKTEDIRLYFYKESSKTNLLAIERNPREVDRYSNAHDLVYCYIVKLNGSTVREKFKNGEVIETTAKNIRPPKFKIIQRQ